MADSGLSGRARAWAACGVAALALTTYARVLGVGFFSDDYEWLGRMAPTLEDPTYACRVFYRDFNPVLHLSFLLDFVAGGGAPFVFHLTSWAVHAACAAALLLVCLRFTDRLWVASPVAAAWALNPRLSEPVIWPAARGHALATLFALLGVLALGARSPGRRWLGLPLFLLALLCKETALFPLLLAPAFLPEPRRGKAIASALWLVAASFVLINFLLKPRFHLSQAGVGELLRKIPFILLRPLGLGDFYDFGWPMLNVTIALGALLFLALFRTPARTGLLWVALCLVPIVPLDKLSSRYLYMMAAGYAMAACGALPSIAARLLRPAARRAAGAGAAVALLLLLGANAFDIQREIDDYAILSAPYAACLEALRAETLRLRPGQTLVVVDLSERSAPRELTEELRARGTITKLIPLRPRAVGGLIELQDAINVVRAGEHGMLGVAADATGTGDERWVVYDGRGVRRASPPLPAEVPRERLLAARWNRARAFFDAERERRPR